MKYILILLISVNFTISATTLNYISDFSDSQWHVNSSKLNCEIQHTVDRFGTATFKKSAGDRLYTFNFDFFSQPKTITQAKVYLIPNHWQTLPNNYQLFNVDIYEGFNIDFKDINVDRLLQYLQQGYKIGFLYEEHQQINFILNQINFNQSYTNFIDCVNVLLSFSFEDVKNMTLNFENNSLDLTPYSLEKLSKLLEYIKEEQNFKEIKINSYSDSYGSPDKNLTISKERREHVIQQLINLGVDKNIVTGKAFGERHFISDNNSPKSREKNRRVTIYIFK